MSRKSAAQEGVKTRFGSGSDESPEPDERHPPSPHLQSLGVTQYDCSEEAVYQEQYHVKKICYLINLLITKMYHGEIFFKNLNFY